MLYYMNLFYSKNKMRDIYKTVLMSDNGVRVTKIKQYYDYTRVPLFKSFYHIHTKYISDKLSIINGNIINDEDYLYVYVTYDNSDSQSIIQGKYIIDIYTTDIMLVNGIYIPIKNIVQINRNDKVIYDRRTDGPRILIKNIPFYSLIFYNDDGKRYTGLGAAYPGDMISFKGVYYWKHSIYNIDVILPDKKDTICTRTLDSSYIELKCNDYYSRYKISLKYNNKSYSKKPSLELRTGDGIHYNVFSIQIGEPVFWRNIYEIAMRQRHDLQFMRNNHTSDDNQPTPTISNTLRKCIDNNPLIPSYFHIYNIPEEEEYDGNVVHVENHSCLYSGYVMYYRGSWICVEHCAS